MLLASGTRTLEEQFSSTEKQMRQLRVCACRQTRRSKDRILAKSPAMRDDSMGRLEMSGSSIEQSCRAKSKPYSRKVEGRHAALCKGLCRKRICSNAMTGSDAAQVEEHGTAAVVMVAGLDVL